MKVVEECAESERQVLLRAKRTITLRISVVITFLVLVVGTLAYVVMLSGQRQDAGRELTMAVDHHAGTSPPGCVWLYTEHDGVVTGTGEQPPAGFPLTADLSRAATGTAALRSTVDRNGTQYTVLTQARDGVVVQAVYDERYQLADRHSLLDGLAVAEVFGLVVAVITGFVLAGRAIAPLGEALLRQRRFVADASHELRAPLTQLHTRAQLLHRLVRRDGGPGRVGDEMARLVAGTRQLGEVVDDLLLSAQLRNDPPELTTVDLGAVVREAAAAETARAQNSELTVLVRQDDSATVVPGVPTALRRVVAALLDNAIGHTLPGGRITLDLRTVDGGRTVQLTVRDDGVGFDQKDAIRIFERFARGDAGRGRRFGLGLALVREVVASHGGTISARGELGAGATFTVHLPACRSDVPVTGVRPDPDPIPAPRNHSLPLPTTNQN